MGECPGAKRDQRSIDSQRPGISGRRSLQNIETGRRQLAAVTELVLVQEPELEGVEESLSEG